MPRFAPISLTKHQSFKWLKSADHQFIAQQSAIALVAEELPHALVTMPIGFCRKEDGSFELAAICSLDEQHNLFVHPDGRWVGSYRPAMVRSYPFTLRHDSDQQQYLLCVDEASGLLVDSNDSQGEPFFNELGEPAELLGNIMEFLTKWERQRQVTQRAVNMLADFNLIAPWNINMTTEDGRTVRTLRGFYRIDEQALNALPSDKFEALRQVSAFPIAYAQMFSQHRLDILVRLSGLHKNWSSQESPAVDLESLFDSGDDSISFDFDS